MPVIANISAKRVYEDIYGRLPPCNLAFSHCDDVFGRLSVLETVSSIVLGRVMGVTTEQLQDNSWLRGAYEAFTAANEWGLEKALRSHRHILNDLEDLERNNKVRIYRPQLPLVDDKSVVFLERGDVALAVRFGKNGTVKAYFSFPLVAAKTEINSFRRKLKLGAYLIQREERNAVFGYA
jgi:hypothetical protein